MRARAPGAAFVAEGYARLNRDEDGGSLRGLLPALDAALDVRPARAIVLDNTYVLAKSRAAVIQAAAARGFPVRCVWLPTSVEDAQVNAAWRMVSRYGRLLGSRVEMRQRRHDVAAFCPAVQFRYQRELEPPDAVRRLFADRHRPLRAHASMPRSPTAP